MNVIRDVITDATEHVMRVSLYMMSNSCKYVFAKMKTIINLINLIIKYVQM